MEDFNDIDGFLLDDEGDCLSGFCGVIRPLGAWNFIHKKAIGAVKKAGKFVGKVAKKAALPVGLGLATGGLGFAGGGLLNSLKGLVTKEGGGLDIEKLLSIGGAGLGMFESIKQGRKKAGIQGQQSELADFQLAGGRELFEGGRDIRDASRQQLLARLRRGALQAPDVSGLADTANPFRSRFNFDVSTPPIGALQPPGRDAQPRSGGEVRASFDRVLAGGGGIKAISREMARNRPQGPRGSGGGFFSGAMRRGAEELLARNPGVTPEIDVLGLFPGPGTGGPAGALQPPGRPRPRRRGRLQSPGNGSGDVEPASVRMI